MGNTENSIDVVKFAITLAKATGSRLIFWHTTWPNVEIDSDIPEENMCPEAADVVSRSVQLARDAGVGYHLEIVMWPGEVAAGCVFAAHEYECNLIIMKPSPGVIQGSWCKDVVDYSTIPVLVLA